VFWPGPARYMGRHDGGPLFDNPNLHVRRNFLRLYATSEARRSGKMPSDTRLSKGELTFFFHMKGPNGYTVT
jgi:hypothetical protein